MTTTTNNKEFEAPVYQGSTKDIFYVSSEEYLFKFSDRYSIFDFGEMPNLIPHKGESTARLTESLFRYFEKSVPVKTHLLRRGINANELIVKRFNVPRDFDHSVFYNKRPLEAFVPLEVIFRMGVPEGSSLLKRGDYKIHDRFIKPMIEFSTKLESIDRMLSYEEAKLIAGLNDQEFEDLVDLTSKIAFTLNDLVNESGLVLWDGKFEFAFIEGEASDRRKFALVDSISLDELRITLDGFPLSKEILRQIYKHSEWYEDLVIQKSMHQDTFRDLVKKPFKLNEATIETISKIYLLTQNLLEDNQNQNDQQLSKLKKCIGELKNEYPHCW
jgi:phosphoribosylaminoimidazole-succinocarboxamide synthase